MVEGMEASFCTCDFDGDPSEWCRTKTVKARKEHRCCECGGSILPGDWYQRINGKWDGAIEEYKTCLVCAQIRSDYCAPLSMLRETLWEGLEVDYLGEWDEDDG